MTVDRMKKAHKESINRGGFMDKGSQALRVNKAGSLSSSASVLMVGSLEKALLKVMPARDACSWDRTGLLVGNPTDVVQKVAIALDPTIPALEQAIALGANVLVTHHPVFLDSPCSFVPYHVQGHTSGSVVRYAIEHGISILSFHTALDVSVEGLDVLPALLRLQSKGVLEPLEHDSKKGFGRICEPAAEDAPLSLRHLSARCVSVFGSLPRVWGAPETQIARVVTSGGSAGSFVESCLSSGIDCLICGEIKYHEALDASLSGLAIIELGHDVSERPLCTLLAAHVAAVGVDESCITILEQNENWYTPESARR